MRRLFALPCLLLAAAIGAAEPPPVWAPTIERLGSADGLPSHSLYSVTQDRDGFLWFGSDSGAVRYDGKRMRVLRAEAGSRPRIATDAASQVFAGADGALWIGTWGGGLDRVDLDGWEVRNWHYDADDPHSLASNYVQALHQGADGVLWVGTGAGLMRLDPASGRMERALTRDEGARSLGGLRIWSIAEDSRGQLWLGTDSGLVGFEPASGQVLPHPLAGNARSVAPVVRVVVVDHADRIWVAPDIGFGRYDPETARFEEVPMPDAFGEAGLIVNRALAAGGGRWWLGTWSGVWLLDTEAATFVEIGGSGLRQWFPADDVRGLHLDATGQLWAATRYNGAARIQLDSPRFRLYRNELAQLPGGTGSNVVRAIYRGDGRLWLNTDGAMVAADLDRAAFDALPVSLGRRVGRFGPSAFDDAGRAWVATLFGPARIDDDGRRIEPLRTLLPSAGVRDPNLAFVLRDSRQRLWWATQREGIVVSDLEGRLLQHHPPGPGSDGRMVDSGASCAFEDSRQRVWLCSYIGLSRWNDRSGRFDVFRHDPADVRTLSHQRVSAIFEDSAGRLWIGTGAGLDRWDEAGDDFVRHRPNEGPIPVAAVLEGEPGQLWVASDRNLRRFDAERGQFVGPPVDPGEPGLQFSENAALALDARRLLFGSNRGLLLFDPARATPAGFAPPVVITRAWIDREEVLLRNAAGAAAQLTLAPGASVLELEFAALDFRAPAQNRHAYRLDGFDADWVDAGEQTLARYTNLAPGDYVFRVRAAGPDQVWNLDGAALALRVQPPWWRDLRVQLPLALLLVLAAWFGARAWAARVRAREAELERLVDERTATIGRQQQQLSMQEKLASLGTLTAGVAHEINNPVNFAHVGAQNLQAALGSFHAQLLQLAGPDADPAVLALFDRQFTALHDQLDTICEGATRIRAIVGHLRSFSRLDEGERLSVRVDDGLQSTLALARMQYGAVVRFELDLQSRREIDAWPAQLNQVYMNLIVNACQAIIARHGEERGDGCLQIHSRDSDGGVEIEFVDNGEGVRSEHLSRIFEPFFTTKGIGEGTGMGLAIAYGIVHRHGGRLDVESERGSGTRVRVWLPPSPPADREPADGDESSLHPHKEI